MSTTQTALFVGLVLGIVATFGGFGTFVVVLVFGAIGLVVGRVLEGKLDLRSLTGQSSAKLRDDHHRQRPRRAIAAGRRG